MNIYYLLKIFLVVCFFTTLLSCSKEPEVKDILTPIERAWLNENKGKIIIDRYNVNWPPMESFDKDGNLTGISVDYYRLIEKKINFKFVIDEPHSFEERMNRLKFEKIHVSSNIQNTPEKKNYLLFTKPYIEIPNVIITRSFMKGEFDLNEMDGMSIAVGKNFAINEYLKRNYKHDLVELESEQKVMEAVAVGKVDAAVVNLAAASYIIERKGYANLRVAGTTGYKNKLSIGSVKGMPILNIILEKGLAEITDEESEAIRKKWINLELLPFYKSDFFRLFLIVTIVVISISTAWIVILTKEIIKRKKVQKEREKLIEELQDALSKIKTLSGLVPICSNCRKIRDGEGYWRQIEEYLEKHTDALFSHGICSDCAEELYGKEDWFKGISEKP